MVTVEPIKPPRTEDPKELRKFLQELCKRFSYLSGVNSPVADSILPRWAGDNYYASGSGDWWRSTGVTAASWEQVTFAAGVVGDHGTLTGLSDDDHSQYHNDTRGDVRYPKHSLATAVSDFLVASGAGAFIKKTLAEVKTILGLGTAAYTAAADYAVAAKGVTNGDIHDHSGGDGAQIAYSTLSGLPTTVNFVDRGDPSGWDSTTFTTDENWYDWDLSSIVPAGAKFVLIRVDLTDGAVGSFFQIRKNGNSNAYNADTMRTVIIDVTESDTLMCALDSNRVIEYRASNVTFSSIEAVVRGWFI